MKNTNLSYNGEVTIEIKKGNYIIKKIKTHNNGTSLLFSRLASALYGKYDNSLHPQYIRLFNRVSTGEGSNIQFIDTPSSSRNVRYTKINVETIDSLDTTSVEFKFYIPFTEIIANTNILKLFSDTGIEQPLAEVSLEDEIINDNISDIIIYWKLYITN